MSIRTEAQNKLNIKIGIVGCGNIAKVHLRYINQCVDKENVALCEKDELRLDNFSQKNSIEKVYKDLDVMLSEFQPDVVHILTPPATHKNIAVKCLEKGSHVLIEKPMCITSEEANEIIRIAHEKKLLVCVDLMRLFEPLTLKAKETLNKGELGDIVNISASYSYDYFKRVDTDPASRWIKDLPGGVFFDLIPHPLCLLEEFMPELKVDKSVTIKNPDGLITDLWSIFTSSRTTATLHMSLNIFPLKNYIVFECTRGILNIDFRNFLVFQRKCYKVPNAAERIIGNFNVGMQILNGTFASIFNFVRGKLDPYTGLETIIRKFYIAVKNNTESPVSPEKAKRLLILTEEIFSEQERKTREIKEENEPKNADVLVTGGTGFIGRRLVNKLLKEGHRVRILTHRNLNYNELKSISSDAVEIISGDIYNSRDVENACHGIDTVYHLAAAMKGDWIYHLDTTITGTQNIINASLKNGVKNLVYVSTLNVYNAKRYPHNDLIDETFLYEDEPDKRGSYSNAKLKAEKLVVENMNRNGISISILRPGLVYGPGREVFLRDVGYRIGKKLVVVLGNGKRKIPLVYVDNLIEALLLVGEAKEKGRGAFNVVDKDYPTQREFIKTYKKLSKERFITIYVPMWIILSSFWLIERMVSIFFKKSVFLRYKVRSINKNVIHNTERLEKKLGWVQKISFEEGIKLVINHNVEKN